MQVPLSSNWAVRPKWHWLYLVLAAFVLLTISFSLYLNHRLMTLYTKSVRVNQEWGDRLNRYSKLAQLAAAVDAPGNDVFYSQDAEGEAERLKAALGAFDQALAEARDELALLNPSQSAPLLSDLAQIRRAMDEMHVEAKALLDHFRKNQRLEASKRMATMDREFAAINVIFAHLREGVREIQSTQFAVQETAATSLRRYEILIAGCIAAMVLGVMLYGQKLATAMKASDQERERFLAELQESKQKLSDILDNVSAYIYLKDTHGHYLYANRPLREFFNASMEAIIGNGDEKFWDAETVTKLREQDHHVIARGETLKSENSFPNRHTGQMATYWSVNLPLRHEDGSIYALCGITTDITERHRTEQRERSRNQVLELLARAAPLREILESIVRSVEQEKSAIRCVILLMDEAGQRLRTGAAPSLPDLYNSDLADIKIGSCAGYCGTAAVTGKRVIVENLQTHPYCGIHCAYYRELGVKAGFDACWSEPIKSAAGKVLGIFAMYYLATPSTNGDIHLMERAAHLAGIAIERSRANEEQQLSNLVYRNSSEAMVVTNAGGTIITVNPAFTELTGYTLDEAIGQNPKILSSGRQDKAFYQAMWHAINTTGHWQGEIWNRRKNGEVYVEWLTINTIFNEDGSPHRRVALFSDITQKKEAEELIWQQANLDLLTGLPNRRLFYDRLKQEMKKAHRAGLPLALMFLDIDRFKEVNDTLGHSMGDILLKEAAPRLSSCVRETDTVARLGGDEFTVILGQLGDPGSVERIAQDILRKLSDPFRVGDEVAYLSGSIGITFYPEDAATIDDLLKNADQAMYAAKRQGRNRYSYFTPSMQEAAQTRMRLIGDIRKALAAHQFRIVYQPIVELATGVIHKAEALIRWQHPARGLISPGEFIPIAEETGMIIDIGDWLFREAARQAVRWRASHHAEFQVSINVSPVQFHSRGDGQTAWFDYLLKLSLPGQSLVVEITEGLLLDASPATTDKLLAFRDAGMQVAIDDFGTGYSALSYLKKFDIDYLKIDQSFVRNLAPGSSDMALSEAIIVMAHKLGMKVIAEGVESEEQRDLLTAAGCDYGQGYLFSRPVPAEEFDGLLKT